MMTKQTPLFLLLSTLLMISCVKSQALCSNGQEFCLFATPQPEEENVKFTIEFNADSGWAAVGFGQAMRQAEVYTVYFNGDSPVLVRRVSSQRSLPDPVEGALLTNGDFVVINEESGRVGVKKQVTFTRKFNSAPVQDGFDFPIVKGQQNNMIWAFGTNQPSGESDGYGIHRSRGSLAVDLFSESSSTSGTFTPVAEEGLDRVVGINVHGSLEFLAWFVLAPFGILIARYSKEKLGVWWFRLHSAFLTLATLFTIVGFVFVYIVKADHFDQESSAGRAHAYMGLIVLILAIINFVSGPIIDKLFDPNRTKVPVWDKLHWMNGRLTGLLAWIVVPMGLALYQDIVLDVGVAVIVLFSIWWLLIILAFVYFEVSVGQKIDKATIVLETTETQTTLHAA